ncbi:DUF4381 domain-containing protein [Lutibacter holmesii]|uniref:DUF4381 domain-containing protein n=1 Tax=Lutibacter holmesii TaxID=1137985 RepID=A0ABW3WPS2_9FLAO
MKIGVLTYLKFLILSSFSFQQDVSSSEPVGTILEPDPLPFTFETIGWKVLAVLLLIVLVFTLYKQFKLYKKNTYRRVAIKKIEAIESSTAQNEINNLNIVLKQVAITTFGRENVANLFGNEWLVFLDSKSKKGEFLKYEVDFFDAIYKNKKVNKSTLKEICKTSKNWIKTHA